jgi:hypothetical protein
MRGGSSLAAGKEAVVSQSPRMDLTGSEVGMAGMISAICMALVCVLRAVVQLAPCHHDMRWSMGEGN